MKTIIGTGSYIGNQPKNTKAKSKSIVTHFFDQLHIAACFLIALFFTLSFGSQAQGMSNNDLGTKFRQTKKEVRQQKDQLKALDNIPEATFTQFKSDFPNAKNATWSVIEDGKTEVDFTHQNHSKMAFYGDDSKLIGTGYYVSYNQIPNSGREKIAREYKGYTPVKSMFFDDDETNSLNMTFLGFPVVKDSYFTELKNNNKQIVVQIDTDGEVSYLTEVR